MIGRAALRSIVCVGGLLLLLVDCRVLSGSIEGLDGLRGLRPVQVLAVLVVVVVRVVHGVRVRQVALLLQGPVDGLCFPRGVGGRGQHSRLSQLQLVRGRGVVARVIGILRR